MARDLLRTGRAHNGGPKRRRHAVRLQVSRRTKWQSLRPRQRQKMFSSFKPSCACMACGHAAAATVNNTKNFLPLHVDLSRPLYQATECIDRGWRVACCKPDVFEGQTRPSQPGCRMSASPPIDRHTLTSPACSFRALGDMNAYGFIVQPRRTSGLEHSFSHYRAAFGCAFSAAPWRGSRLQQHLAPATSRRHRRELQRGRPYPRRKRQRPQALCRCR
jgi:hypothetical protein